MFPVHISLLALLATLSSNASTKAEDMTTTRSTPPPEIGLFVTVRWRRWTPGSWDSSEPCDAMNCTRTGCIPQITGYNLEGVCVTRIDSTITEATGSLIYQYTEDRNQVVLLDFSDADCQDSNNRREFYELEGCDDFDPIPTERVYLPNFCIASPTPIGAFVTPLVELYSYGTEALCQSQAKVRITRFIPNDASLCVQGEIATQDGMVYGSSRNYCTDSEEFMVQRYTDTECKKQGSDLLFPQSNNQGCFVPALPGQPDIEFRLASPCSNPPRFHCKNLADALGVITSATVNDQDELSPSNSDESSSSSARNSAGSCGCIVVCATTIIALWFFNLNF